MDKKGKVVSKEKVSTDRESIQRYFKKTRSKEKVKVKAVMEACYGWQYFYEGTLFYCSIFLIDDILPKDLPAAIYNAVNRV